LCLCGFLFLFFMRPTWAEVRLDHIASNYRAIKSLAGQGVKVMAVVKANAYGHGSVPVATHLEKEGVDWFGVALVEEGIELREAGIRSPILSLGGFWQEDQASACIEHDLTPALYRLDMLDTLQKAARAANRNISYHLKLDTGMGRLGVMPELLPEFLERAKNSPNLTLDGLMTHLASADEPQKSEATTNQISRFFDSLEQVRAHGFNPSYRHISNSAGTHGWPQARCNMVRTGGLLYGFWRDIIAPSPPPPPLSPALSLHSRITLLKRVGAGATLGYGGTFRTERDSLIAIIPIGYHDGLRRAYSNNGRVIVRGRFAPIVGRVSMDLTIIDVSDINGVELGDEVILIGRSGDSSITAEEMGSWIGTISFEVSCAISERVPRIYSKQ
jgi:alanine racemase